MSINIKILDETTKLEAVVLGTAINNGATPKLDSLYDPKSKESLLSGIYPLEEELIKELEAVKNILEKYDVEVYRPGIIENYNQVFARDIAFVLDDSLIVPCVTTMRKKESEGITYLSDKVDKVLLPGEDERMEGGDVIICNDHLFVGYTPDEEFDRLDVARTNEKGVAYLKSNFKKFQIHPFELIKSDVNSGASVLHLDCCFQPVGEGKAIICKEGFKNSEDLEFLIDFFGEKNAYFPAKEKMKLLTSNIFSISPEVIISDKRFVELNRQLRQWGIKVEEKKYSEISKMGGLFRCTTLPLRRNYD